MEPFLAIADDTRMKSGAAGLRPLYGRLRRGTHLDELNGAERRPLSLRLVREWAESHWADLEEDWRRARDGEPLERIAPLP
jgi:hypothetical protein